VGVDTIPLHRLSELTAWVVREEDAKPGVPVRILASRLPVLRAAGPLLGGDREHFERSYDPDGLGFPDRAPHPTRQETMDPRYWALSLESATWGVYFGTRSAAMGCVAYHTET